MEKLVANKDFWQKRRVLITGHTGFKGSWLSLWLQSLGAEVFGVALEADTKPSLFKLAKVENGMNHNIADIRNFSLVQELMDEFMPEVIFHMAAQPLVRESYKNPILTYETNVMGTIHVLEAARKTGTTKAIVNITTDKCYENDGRTYGYKENDRMGGYDPYSNSKACAELVSSAYRLSFLAEDDIAMATVRAGNVIGGGDWAKDRLVPDILHALEKNISVEVRNPNATRPWQHVLEPISGYLLLAEKLYTDGTLYAEGWNFGPNEDDTKSVKWIIENLYKKWGSNISWSNQPGKHPHEANYLKLDVTKTKKYLGWRPSWSLDYSLIQIVDWHKAFLNNEDMKLKTLQQIQLFTNFKS